MPEKKFDTNKFVAAFSKGLPAHATQEQKVKTAVGRAKRLTTAIKDIQTKTGLSEKRSINVLRGISIAQTKFGVSKSTLLKVTGGSFGSSFKNIVPQLEQLGSGKSTTFTSDVTGKSPSIKRLLDPRPGGPFSLKGKIPKPPSPKTIGKGIARGFKKIF